MIGNPDDATREGSTDEPPLSRSTGGVDVRGLQGILSTVQDATRAGGPATTTDANETSAGS